MVLQLRSIKCAVAKHKITCRFDERKDVRPLIFSDLRQIGVRVNSDVFRSRGSQQPSQRATDEQITPAGRVKCITPGTEQDIPRWMVGITSERHKIKLLNSNRSARFE